MKNRLTLDCPALADVTVLEASVTERPSTPTAARVTILAQTPLDVTAAIGAVATLSLEVDHRASRSFTLVVTTVTAERTDADDLTYSIELEHATALLGLRHDTRLFLDKSVKDIAQEVLMGAGRPAPAWSLMRAPVARETCLQRIFGLVTTVGDFYSILMLSQPGNEWCVGGIKRVQPIDHDTLKLRMLHED